DSRGVRMRSRSNQTDDALPSGDIIALLQAVSNDVDWEPLLFCIFRVTAGDTERSLTCQPIDCLAMVATESDLHVTEKFVHEFRAESWVFVHEPKCISRSAGNRRIVTDNLALPF